MALEKIKPVGTGHRSPMDVCVHTRRNPHG